MTSHLLFKILFLSLINETIYYHNLKNLVSESNDIYVMKDRLSQEWFILRGTISNISSG